ncbi:hypothetical protein AB840_01805 [Megasphaera cerevisiae DSM 20462]|uniref:Uncharacterized protein n=1 Tax=Megasphaera cerevisiae DSM 20462 TaxID=1122219 RepID=A0A0J6X0G8_9FIRM|nr:hypothetical protein [Megasphaera cerevisiae]KMO87652.1 hypothetical protein AB840_01805 [Megasphaera cerevisiae DSM 20462]SKA23416.1 hypothetical protein SAMN05660900_02942 [Megasphaera cerevisiae DSM 20462]
MRAQFFDGFDFSQYKFSIVAVEHVNDLFQIETFGLHPIMYNEACLRGYTCIFGFNEDKKLALHKLLTNNNGMPAPDIDGAAAVPFRSPAGDLKYELHHAIDYTGSILIANSFIEKYFVPFGFQLPHAFRKVFELTFDHGVFVQVDDRSEQARQLRIEYEEPVGPRKKVQIRLGGLMNKSEEYGFDDETIAQYMDLSYDTKYLFT